MDSVKIQKLNKSYQNFALQNISFNVPEGTVVGVIGENGAGKSTTLNCILGTVKPDSGVLEVFSKSVSQLSETERNHIGAVIGENGLPSNLNVKQVGKMMKSVFSEWNEGVFEKYVTKFALPAAQPIKTLSRGIKQKLMIAVALSHNANLLVLDEPTSGLDPVARDEIIDVFYDFMQSENHAMILSSHILSDLEKICDYILFIHKGKQIFFEEKDALYEKYGILKCGVEDFEKVPKNAVVGFNRTQYGVSALVEKEQISSKYPLERAEIDDIMLYFLRGEKL